MSPCRSVRLHARADATMAAGALLVAGPPRHARLDPSSRRWVTLRIPGIGNGALVIVKMRMGPCARVAAMPTVVASTGTASVSQDVDAGSS